MGMMRAGKGNFCVLLSRIFQFECELNAMGQKWPAIPRFLFCLPNATSQRNDKPVRTLALGGGTRPVYPGWAKCLPFWEFASILSRIWLVVATETLYLLCWPFFAFQKIVSNCWKTFQCFFVSYSFFCVAWLCILWIFSVYSASVFSVYSVNIFSVLCILQVFSLGILWIFSLCILQVFSLCILQVFSLGILQFFSLSTPLRLSSCWKDFLFLDCFGPHEYGWFLFSFFLLSNS